MDNIVRCTSVKKERIRNTFAKSNSIRRMDLLFWAFTPHNFSLEINVSSIMTGEASKRSIYQWVTTCPEFEAVRLRNI